MISQRKNMTQIKLNKEQKNLHQLLEKYHIKSTKNQRVQLSFLIQDTLSFNRSLLWDTNTSNVFLVNTAEELIEIYKLRSKIYKQMGYDEEFPDSIEGLNFDFHDKHSAILYTKNSVCIIGTCRIIFDRTRKLPMDKNFSLDYLRTKDNKLAELSRLMIHSPIQGLGQEPKYLTQGAYLIMQKNQLTTLMSVMVEEHYKLYSKFGGFKVEKKVKSHGKLKSPFIITSWQISEISSFFKKVFLAY